MALTVGPLGKACIRGDDLDIVSFVAGNTTAESKIKSFAGPMTMAILHTKAMKAHYKKGVGMNSINILNMDKILDSLFHHAGGWNSSIQSLMQLTLFSWIRKGTIMKICIVTKNINADFCCDYGQDYQDSGHSDCLQTSSG